MRKESTMSTVQNNLQQRPVAFTPATKAIAAIPNVLSQFQSNTGRRESDDQKREKELPVINRLVKNITAHFSGKADLGTTGAAGSSTANRGQASQSTIIGTDQNDRLIGTNKSDTIIGKGGNDVIKGEGGDDILHGNRGNDFIHGGKGNDLLFGGSGRDKLYGGQGDDVLNGGRGRDTLNGGNGSDILVGGKGNDVLRGGKGDDILLGGKGRDTLHGGQGNDVLLGGQGRDVLRGGSGADVLFGGKGNDTLRGGLGHDVLLGGEGKDRLNGGSGNDTLYGGNGNDRLNGGRGHDELQGGAGNDKLRGGRGNDHLNGGAGNDKLNGGRGNDVLVDNQGNNTIDGGRGQDTVELNAVISNYTIKEEKNGFTLTNKSTGATNRVKNVESFSFSDVTLNQVELKTWIKHAAEHQYRSADGSNNNLSQNTLGSANTAFTNIVAKDPDRMLEGVSAARLPNVREISNTVSAQTENTVNKKGLSDMFWLYGQFLDHDINLTPTNEGDAANIKIPKGDAFFDPTGSGIKEMHFNRSVALEGQTERTQVNIITAYIDGSNIYGSSKEKSDKLRSHEGGKLIMGADNYLPKSDDGQYFSGDVRANENAGLTSMHTLWAREHNRVADKLSTQNPEWKDEKIYQESRKWVVAEMQAVTYNEYLPALLGGSAPSEYKGYDSNVNPQVSNTFATAAYRLGHTMLSPTILRLDEQGQEIPEGNLKLRDAFFQPQHVSEAGIDPILRGLATQTAQAVDPMLVDDVRNFLFGAPGADGFDLASLNLQRGRDHGVAGYNDVREGLGLPRIASFDDPIFQDGVGEKLKTIYKSPDDMDLWVAGLAEKSQGDSLVGSSFTTIVKDQFERLRSGDRFWYENQFSTNDVNSLNQLKLSDIILRNSDIQNIQENVFVAPTNQPVVQVASDNITRQAQGNQGLTGDAARAVATPLVDAQTAADIVNRARNAQR